MKLIIFSYLFFINGVELKSKWETTEIVGKWKVTWTSKDYSYEENKVPDLNLDYGNGTSEIIELSWYSPVKGYESECNFIGHMKRDHSYNAIINGCPDDPTFRVMINTPLEAYIRLLNNSLVSSDRSGNVNENKDELLRIFSEDEDDDDLSRSFSEGYIENNTKVWDVENLDFDSFTHKLPKELFFRVGIAFDDGVFRFFNGDEKRTYQVIAIFLSHLQFIFHHKSLGTKITFDTPFPVLDLKGRWDCRRESLSSEFCGKALNTLIDTEFQYSKFGNMQHCLGLGHSKDNGLLGLSVVSAGCKEDNLDSKRKSMSKLITKNNNYWASPRVMAHELSHNLGFGHVKPECGEGHFMGGGGFTRGWSICHKYRMADIYDRATTARGGYCMDREDPSETGGSWTPWYTWSDACKDCTHKRTRTCVGYNCEGFGEEYKPCDSERCNKKGTWSPWTSWSNNCKDCKYKRARKCYYGDAEDCPGSDVEYKTCEFERCILKDNWSPWSAWGNDCKDCKHKRTRKCYGDSCPGSDEDFKPCESERCKRKDTWSSWSEWSDKCKDCNHKRTRRCYGDNCPGVKEEYKTCEIEKCLNEGSWSSWSNWSEKCKDCKYKRTRKCYGDSCPGSGEDYKPCESKRCLKLKV